MTTRTCVDCLRTDGSQTASRDARELIIEQLRRLDLLDARDPQNDERTTVALLVVSELVGNAYRHTSSGPEAVRVVWHDQYLTVEVDDGDPTRPTITPAVQRGESGGYGIDMVSRLADVWGVRGRQDSRPGKTVFASLSFR